MPSRANAPRISLLVAFLLGAVAPALSAQSAGGGLLDGVPFILSMQDGELAPAVAKGSDSLDKPAGIYTMPPAKANLGPKYGFLGCDESSLFLNPATQMVPLTGPAPDIDALSSALDWIAATPGGLLFNDPSPGFWAAIVFSVTKATVGLNTNSGVIRRESTGPGGKASGDLFSYLWPGSQVPPSEARNVAVLSVDSTEINLHGTAPPVPLEMDAVDVFLSLYQLIGSFPGFDLPAPELFFSVSDATKNRIPNGWVGGNAALKSGATIFRMTVVEVPPGSGHFLWTQPAVAFAPAAIGLGSSEDVDALAFDVRQGYLLLSTDHTLSGVPRRDPILFVNLASDTPSPVALALSRTPAVTVSSRVDLSGGPLPDDVNSICAIDPRGGQRTHPFGELLAHLIGAPTLQAPPVGSAVVHMSVYHTPGPGVHFLVRNLPPNHLSVVLLSAFPTFVPIGSNALMLNPHLALFAWNPLLSDQQARVNFIPDPFLVGRPAYYQSVGLDPASGQLFATYILDILF